MAAQSFKGPLDYIDVATRIVEFRERYPDGRLRQRSLEFVRDFAGKDWVVYTAEAWRTQDDPAPAQGTAWEPVPGPTQFTRDSEVQNAETAAWGRAMVAALAVDTRKGIASSEEVRNRQQTATTTRKPIPNPAPFSEGDVNTALAELSAAGSLDELQSAWERAAVSGATRDPRVIQSKDDMKGVLS